MPVELLDPRGEVPEQKLKACIEALEKKGAEVGAIVFFQNSILVHWKQGTPTKKQPERR